MIRLRNAKARICHRFSALRRKKPTAQNRLTIRMAQVTSAVHQRQLAGMTTTLRQLHTATELDQPVALNLVAELERAGIVVIDRNIGDAFESTITLSEEARRQLELATAQKAKAAAA